MKTSLSPEPVSFTLLNNYPIIQAFAKNYPQYRGQMEMKLVAYTSFEGAVITVACAMTILGDKPEYRVACHIPICFDLLGHSTEGLNYRPLSDTSVLSSRVHALTRRWSFRPVQDHQALRVKFTLLGQRYSLTFGEEC